MDYELSIAKDLKANSPREKPDDSMLSVDTNALTIKKYTKTSVAFLVEYFNNVAWVKDNIASNCGPHNFMAYLNKYHPYYGNSYSTEMESIIHKRLETCSLQEAAKYVDAFVAYYYQSAILLEKIELPHVNSVITIIAGNAFIGLHREDADVRSQRLSYFYNWQTLCSYTKSPDFGGGPPAQSCNKIE